MGQHNPLVQMHLSYGHPTSKGHIFDIGVCLAAVSVVPTLMLNAYDQIALQLLECHHGNLLIRFFARDLISFSSNLFFPLE